MNEPSKEIPEEELQDYFVPVSWEMSGYVVAKGICPEDAYLKVKNYPDEYPLPDLLASEYSEGSFTVSFETSEDVELCKDVDLTRRKDLK